jgi:hypothetical protein
MLYSFINGREVRFKCCRSSMVESCWLDNWRCLCGAKLVRVPEAKVSNADTRATHARWITGAGTTSLRGA